MWSTLNAPGIVEIFPVKNGHKMVECASCRAYKTSFLPRYLEAVPLCNKIPPLIYAHGSLLHERQAQNPECARRGPNGSLRRKTGGCRTTKIRLLHDLQGGALPGPPPWPFVAGQIAYAASMFVNPNASWSSAFELLGSQALRGVTHNMKHARR